MASLNRVVLIGNLTRDPEVRSTPDGAAVANLRIAVNRPWTNKEGQRDADYFTIVAWRKLADLCGQYLSKGSPVAIEGRLQSRSWETADGQKRSTIEIVADNIQFLSRSSATSTQIASNDDSQDMIETSSQEFESVAAATNESTDDLPDDDIPF